MSENIQAWRLRKSTMCGGVFLPYVYTEELVAKAKAEEMKEEWVDYEVKEVAVRVLNEQEGAIGNDLVQIRRDTWHEHCLETAFKKLTPDERKALKEVIRRGEIRR